jgi:hypothetical protein
MKRFLVVACALGLSAPMAFADCAYHRTNAAADADRATTTASIASDPATSSDELVLLKRQKEKAVETEKTAE